MTVQHLHGHSVFYSGGSRILRRGGGGGGGGGGGNFGEIDDHVAVN